MTVSHTTIQLICDAVQKHVTEQQFKDIVRDLLRVPGNESFRVTIRRLATKLGME